MFIYAIMVERSVLCVSFFRRFEQKTLNLMKKFDVIFLIPFKQMVG